MKSKKFGWLAVLVTVSAINAGIIYQDDFSDPGTSTLNWVASNSEVVTKSFAGGECSISNVSSGSGGLLIHEMDNLPSKFTISFKINKTTGTLAGFYFCLGLSGVQYTGYQVRIDNGSRIIVQKYSSAVTELLAVQSAYIANGYNEIKISKNGTTFNVFCNGQFEGSFTDSEFSSGDVAMVLGAGTSAKFDDVLITDQFEEANARTCFSDDFDGASLVGWIKDDKGEAVIDNKQLKISTTDESYRLMTKLELENFVAKVTVSHRSGSNEATYGICLQGDVSGEIIPIAGFVINGKRMYGTFIPSTSSYTLLPSQKIRGAAFTDAGETYYYNDTLEVSKQVSSGYIFKVNNSPLCTIPDIGFKITSIGLYCSDSLNLLFNDFVAAEGDEAVCSDGPTSIVEKKINRPALIISKQPQFVIDPLGRVVLKVKNVQIQRSVAPGLYIQKEQKRLMVKKEHKN